MKHFALLALIAFSQSALGADEPLGGEDCPGLDAPATLCGEFAATPSLASDPKIRELRARCEAFYASAVRELNVICRYKTDSALRDLATELAASRNDRASAATDTALIERTHDVTARYYVAELEARQAMDAAYKDLKPRLAELAKNGSKLLKQELGCERSGDRGVAPGALQVGLAKHAADQLTAALQPLDDVANRFLYACNGTEIAASAQGESILKLIGKFGAPTRAAKEGKALDPVDGAVPETPKVDVKGIAIKKLEGAAEGAILLPIFGATPLTIAGAGLQVLTDKKIDALAIANASVSVFALALGVGNVEFVAAAAAGDFIEATLRAQWARADAKIVLPYLDYIRANPKLDSADAADGYLAQKKEADYCQKCNERDMFYSYCPAKNEYNPNWWDPTARKGCAKMDWKDPNPAIARGYPLQPTGPGCAPWPKRH